MTRTEGKQVCGRAVVALIVSQVVLVFLKLTGVIGWSVWWVMAPTWAVGIVAGIIVLLWWVTDKLLDITGGSR